MNRILGKEKKNKKGHFKASFFFKLTKEHKEPINNCLTNVSMNSQQNYKINRYNSTKRLVSAFSGLLCILMSSLFSKVITFNQNSLEQVTTLISLSITIALPVEHLQISFSTCCRLERLSGRHRQKGLEKHYLAMCIFLHCY